MGKSKPQLSPEMKRRVALWDAINRYVESCGGDPAKHVYGNTARMMAVVEVERIVFPWPGAETTTKETR